MIEAPEHLARRSRPMFPVARPRVQPSPCGLPYEMHSASVTGSRAARIAGSKPPTAPMTNAHTKPCASSGGVTRKSKATWENEAPPQ